MVGRTPSQHLKSLVRKRNSEGMVQTADELFSTESSHFDSWLLAQRSPSISIPQYLFGVHDGVRGRGASKLIHPLSPFTVGLNIVSSLVIVYFFFEMPVLLAFFWNAPDCFRAATLEVDMAAEVFFFIELALQFFTGVYDESEYFDSFAVVAKKYIKGLLLFDLVTATPVSWIEFAILHSSTVCQDQNGELSSGYSSYLYAKVPIRMLRPLRLIKIIKLFRIVRIFMMVEGQLKMELWLQKAVTLLFTVIFVIHIFCCAFWIIKEVWEDDMPLFLGENGVQDDDVVGKYILSGYFVNTVFTTVGFGDMHGENTVERLFVILMMWSGTICFAVVVSEMQDMVSKFNARNYSRRERIDTCRHFLRSHNSPRALEKDIIDWVQFSFMVEQDRADRQNLLEALPRDLQERLALHLNRGVLESVPAFRNISSPHRKKFLASLALEVQWKLCRHSETIATMGEVVGKLFMISSGQVKVVACRMESLEENRMAVITTLCAGDFFGSLSSDSKVRTEVNNILFIAEGQVQLSFLTEDAFRHVLNIAPEELKEEVQALLESNEESPYLQSDPLASSTSQVAEVGFAGSGRSNEDIVPESAPNGGRPGDANIQLKPLQHKSMSWINIIPEGRVPTTGSEIEDSLHGFSKSDSAGVPRSSSAGATSSENIESRAQMALWKSQWGSFSSHEKGTRASGAEASQVTALRSEIMSAINKMDKKMDILFQKMEDMSSAIFAQHKAQDQIREQLSPKNLPRNKIPEGAFSREAEFRQRNGNDWQSVTDSRRGEQKQHTQDSARAFYHVPLHQPVSIGNNGNYNATPSYSLMPRGSGNGLGEGDWSPTPDSPDPINRVWPTGDQFPSLLKPQSMSEGPAAVHPTALGKMTIL